MDPLATGLRAGVIVALLLFAAVVARLDRPSGGWLAPVRTRLLLGVPWGTLVSAALILGVYLFAQDGLAHWYRPLTLPFYSWSYAYPTGVFFAPFAHMGQGHLLGNLLGTLALGPLAEAAWSHFPRERGERSFSRPATNPYVRAFVAFPAGVVGVGLLTSLFHWGPVIGFSGVVYAFAGFAIVRYPIGTLVAVLVQRLLGTVLDALRDPILEASGRSTFVDPWFVDIAVQGHLLGFLAGALLGALVLRGRSADRRPGALRVGAATTLFGTLLSPLWAVWYIRGADTYVLHRAAGLVMVVVLGVLVALAVAASRRPFTLSVPLVDRAVPTGLTRRDAGVLALVVPLVFMAGVAIPVNAVAVDGPPEGVETVEVGDYQVTYAENVVRPKTSIVDIELLGERTTVETGGVIVTSDERELWARVVSPGRLESRGTVSVLVGGPAWREEVGVRRSGWSLAAGGSTYRVTLHPPDGGDARQAFVSGNATAGVTLAGRNVSLVPRRGSAAEGAEGFAFAISRNGTVVDRRPVPADGGRVVAAGITFRRRGGTITARIDGTRLPIATRSGRD